MPKRVEVTRIPPAGPEPLKTNAASVTIEPKPVSTVPVIATSEKAPRPPFGPIEVMHGWDTQENVVKIVGAKVLDVTNEGQPGGRKQDHEHKRLEVFVTRYDPTGYKVLEHTIVHVPTDKSRHLLYEVMDADDVQEKWPLTRGKLPNF